MRRPIIHPSRSVQHSKNVDNLDAVVGLFAKSVPPKRTASSVSRPTSEVTSVWAPYGLMSAATNICERFADIHEVWIRAFTSAILLDALYNVAVIDDPDPVNEPECHRSAPRDIIITRPLGRVEDMAAIGFEVTRKGSVAGPSLSPPIDVDCAVSPCVEAHELLQSSGNTKAPSASPNHTCEQNASAPTVYNSSDELETLRFATNSIHRVQSANMVRAVSPAEAHQSFCSSCKENNTRVALLGQLCVCTSDLHIGTSVLGHWHTRKPTLGLWSFLVAPDNPSKVTAFVYAERHRLSTERKVVWPSTSQDQRRQFGANFVE
ncbi:hypothetical protein PENSPDRAFT_660315 [Peniophora sp. CONT]|nr:hypothetical protein PENSPDRAFT_660315 [Peniophora sp. CONT]